MKALIIRDATDEVSIDIYDDVIFQDFKDLWDSYANGSVSQQELMEGVSALRETYPAAVHVFMQTFCLEPTNLPAVDEILCLPEW
jgi:hypothetical protein